WSDFSILRRSRRPEMSYTVILEVSKFLKKLLWEGLNSEPVIQTGQYLDGLDSIVLTNPAEPDADRRLSLWLYNVLPNEHLRNAPFIRLKGDNQIQYPALPLNLYYLLTPSTGSDEGDQYVLGKSMQILNDAAVVQFDNPGAVTPDNPDPPFTSEELHI